MITNGRVIAHPAVAIATMVALFALHPSPSFAQNANGSVTLFADESGTTCTLQDTAPGPLMMYVIHRIPEGWGNVACRFSVAASPGFGGTYVGETIHAAFWLGTLRDGIDIAYGQCALDAQLVATITFQGHGTSEPCSYLEIVPHPENWLGAIEVMSCSFETRPAPTLGRLWVNPDGEACSPWCATVPTHETTWGGVKALYR
jgi:hypothetical protein